MNILVIDDEQRVLTEICEYLNRMGHKATGSPNPLSGLEMLKHESFDMLILDVMLPDIGGIEFLRKIKPEFPELDVIVISGHGDMDTVIAALRGGASDYLKKPFRHYELQVAMERVHKMHQMKDEIISLSADNAIILKEFNKKHEHRLIGDSPQIKEVYQLALKAAEYSDLPVMITGESGTGKEIISRLIHFSGERKARNFLAINCSAIPDNMMESEFFGYRRGAFTGAISDRKGYFEYCDKGTLLLDELAEMPMFMQSKLLRVLEEKTITKIGMDKPVGVNVRIISATNKDISKEVQAGKFRLDLYHRINTFQIHIPPLRERIGDIPLLVEHYLYMFSKQYSKPMCKVPDETMQVLMSYSYPGNVRELKNLIERAVLIGNGKTLMAEDFSGLISSTSKLPVKESIGCNFNLDENEQLLVKQALKHTDNNQTKAAELLGISRHALIRKMKQYSRISTR